MRVHIRYAPKKQRTDLPELARRLEVTRRPLVRHLPRIQRP